MDETPDNRLREARATFNLDGAASAADSLRGNVAKQYRAKVFKSGNSLALRLPAELNLAAGTEMLLKAAPDGTYSLAKADAPKRKFNIDKVWGCAIGSGLQPIDEDDRWFEERPLLWDDPEWRAKHMPDV
jgi:antitoxin VapB